MQLSINIQNSGQDHIETGITIAALTKNKEVHKLLQQAPGMQIFSLPTVTWNT